MNKKISCAFAEWIKNNSIEYVTKTTEELFDIWLEKNLKIKYMLEVGHNGEIPGCGYCGEDYWNTVIYGDSIEELAKNAASDKDYVLKDYNHFTLSKINVLVFGDKFYHHKTLIRYNNYTKPNELEPELKEYQIQLRNNRHLSDQIREHRDKIENRLKSLTEAREKRLSMERKVNEYERLKTELGK